MTNKNANTQTSTAPVVIIADADAGVRKLVREILEEKAFVVLEARDGQEALNEIGRAHVDLVILNMSAPQAEGTAIIRMLRYGRPDLKVLAMSGAFSGAYPQCSSLGAHALLKKPFQCQSLSDCVAALFPSMKLTV